MSRLSMIAGVCALMAFGSGAARAQAPGTDALQPALAGAPVTIPQNQPPVALVTSDRLGVSQPVVSNAAAVVDPLAAFHKAAVRHRAPGVALMLVGAAAVVTGLLIDESVITVVGAGVGLVGLYLYLR